MSRARITRILMMLFVVMLTTVLAQAAQKKNNTPPAPKAGPAAKPAQQVAKPVQQVVRPAQRPTAQPARVQPTNGGARQPGGQPSGSHLPGYGLDNNKGKGGGSGNNAPGMAGASYKDPRSANSTRTAGGGTLERSREGKPTNFVSSHGTEAHFSSKGSISQIRDQKRNMTVEHGFRSGDRKIVTVNNGRTTVTTGPHGGYAQRPYVHNRFNRPYVQRTYWVNGHAYAYAYRDHYYHNVHYYRYAPAYYYHPVFYGWAYNPWAAPVYYNWGWSPAAPWFYGGYFAPAPSYPTASLWITDYLLAENLKLAYDNQ